MQGRSLAALLKGQTASVRESFLYEYFFDPPIPGVPEMRGVRNQRWAYVTYPGLSEGEELYSLDADPSELSNVAALPDRAAVKRTLRDELEQLLASTGPTGP